MLQPSQAGSGTKMLFSPSPSQFWHRIFNFCPAPLENPPDPRRKPAFDYLPTSVLESSRLLRPGLFKENVTFCGTHKMETNYDALRIPEFRALVRKHRLRGYSGLRKAALIAFFRDNLTLMPSPRPPFNQNTPDLQNL